MSASMIISRDTSGATASPIRSSQTITADAVTVFDGTIAASQTDVLIALAIDVSQIRGLYMLVEGGDITLQTNNGTTPTDTLVLKNGVALTWDSTSGYSSNPFSGDVTAIYATTGAGSSRDLHIVVLTDATP